MDYNNLTAEDFESRFNQLSINEKTSGIEKSLLLKHAFASNDPNLIMKASSYYSRIVEKDKENPKSLLIDPISFTGQGYKEKSYAISFELLRNMSRTPIIKSIIDTRVEQVVDFAKPQPDKYATGFIIRPKRKSYNNVKDEKISKEQQKRCDEITEWLLNCGSNTNEWHGDNFDSFTRKFIRDSLTYDQGVFEIVENRGGEPIECIGVDGSLFRFTEYINSTEQEKIIQSGNYSKVKEAAKLVKGYPPYYVQIFQGRIIAEFYPWELCFGIRNPQTSILANGYGRSELEDLIHTVTSLLNADAYNSEVFKSGSIPKGLLRVSGNVSEARMEEFRQKWQEQVTGVRNIQKLPVINAEKMDFVPTGQNNRDMEFSKYHEFLIKVSCANYKIDPSEIGFPMSGQADAKPMFEGNNEARLKFSRDKGLKPLITFYESKLNKFIIDRLDPNYEIAFVGINAETPEQELEADLKKVQYGGMSMQDMFKKYSGRDFKDEDIILNPVYMQFKQMQQMSGMGEPDEFDDEGYNPFEKSEKSDPFEESLKNYIEKELV